ncbi:MAG: hypothetical protein ACRDKS_15285 [Actinomycetota bacterium]
MGGFVTATGGVGVAWQRRQGEVASVLFIVIILYTAAIVAVAHALARE